MKDDLCLEDENDIKIVWGERIFYCNSNENMILFFKMFFSMYKWIQSFEILGFFLRNSSYIAQTCRISSKIDWKFFQEKVKNIK